MKGPNLPTRGRHFSHTQLSPSTLSYVPTNSTTLPLLLVLSPYYYHVRTNAHPSIHSSDLVQVHRENKSTAHLESIHILYHIMRISSALLPLLASINVCSGFTTTLPPSTPKSLVRQLISSRQHSSNNKSSTSSSSSQLSVATSTSEIGTPGTADLPWSELGFEFRPTKSHLRMVYRDGKWGEAELVEVRWCYIMSFVVLFMVGCWEVCCV